MSIESPVETYKGSQHH